MLQNKNIVGEEIKKGISVYSACGNREENLSFAIKSWLKCEDIDEVIIVDWNSTIPVSVTHPKITIVRVHDLKWKNSAHALNLGARFTAYDKICKLDADYVISRDFFKTHDIKEGTFYAGNWENAKDENEKHVHGFLYTYRDDFFDLNGFSERVETYGWEDSDMYVRLCYNELTRIDVSLEKIYHLRHDDTKRVLNYEPWWRSKDTDELAHENKTVCEKNPWTKDDKMLEFTIWDVPKNEGVDYYCPIERIQKLKKYYICEQADGD